MTATMEEPAAAADAPEKQETALALGTAFSSLLAFEGAQRMAKCLAASDLVPKQYKGNLPNSIIALEMAQRLDMNPLMVMQNLYIVHNRPAWSSQFLIACVNGCGRFSPLRYEIGEEGPEEAVAYSFTEYVDGEKRRKDGKETIRNRVCVAWAYDKATNEKLYGPPVSLKIAVLEGWYSRNGSKWQTMPELMLRYRAATFFARTYCPDLTMGMRTQEEAVDVDGHEVEARVVESGPPMQSPKAAALMEEIQKRKARAANGPDENSKPEAPARMTATEVKAREYQCIDDAILAEAQAKVDAKRAAEPVDGDLLHPEIAANSVGADEAYARLSRAYDDERRQPIVDACLKEVGLPSLPDIARTKMDAVALAKLNRAASKYAKKISE